MELIRANRDFRLLWLAQTVSQIGSQISFLAIPLVAAVSLNASPVQMGILSAVGSLPALFSGLFLGAITDRVARRPLLISSDALRAILLLVIPIAWLGGFLSLPILYLVTMISGGCALLFDIAYGAFLPSVIDRRHLVQGNSSLELSRSAAEVVGPSLAGLLIQVVKAPLAIAVDAASFALSALLISRIRFREETPTAAEGGAGLLSDARLGIAIVWKSPELRGLAIAGGAIGLFNAMIEAVFIIYLTRTVGMEPGLLGFVFAVGSTGFIVGALIPNRLVRRFGVGPSLAISIFAVGFSDLALPLSGTSVVWVAAAVVIGQFGFGLGMTLFNVTQVSLRQLLVKDHMLGRVGGALRVTALALVPIGALLGGVSGEVFGLRATLFVAAALEAAVALWVWRSPLWRIRTFEVAPEYQ